MCATSPFGLVIDPSVRFYIEASRHGCVLSPLYKLDEFAYLVHMAVARLVAPHRIRFTVWLLGPSLLLLFTAGFVRAKRRERLDWSMVIGLPELSASYHSRVLVTEGIYARVRKPRYIETILFFLGFALFANYLAVYLALLAGLPILHLVVLLEEHELTQVFGDDCLNYYRKVPRYIPNIFQ